MLVSCFRREEVAGEAQRVLRAFPTKSSEKEGPKPMPSFPEMVAYVQEKVHVFLCLRANMLRLQGGHSYCEEIMNLIFCLFCLHQAAQRIKTPAKYIVGTSTIPFNPSAFGEVNANHDQP